MENVMSAFNKQGNENIFLGNKWKWKTTLFISFIKFLGKQG